MAGVLDALASYIQNMLTEIVKEEGQMLLGVSGEIDNMATKLMDLQNFLADADRRNITDQSVQAWVRELRDAMYDATDILDLCKLRAIEQGPRSDTRCFNPLMFILDLCQPKDMEQGLMCDTGCFNPFLFCLRNLIYAHDIGSRIKDLNKRLDDIKARGASFNFINLGTYEERRENTVSSYSGTRETSGLLDESCLVGEQIEEDTRNLVDMLTTEYESQRDCRNIMIFAIVGVGGIGKTTLAQKIFNNDIIQQEFSKKIWLSINQDFNSTVVLRNAITEAGGSHPVTDAKMALLRTLMEALKGHKILLIMDDVWNSCVWDDVLRTPLVNANLARGSRVLVTTRHDIVACVMGAEEPYYRIKKLEHEDAWLLLKKQVVRQVNDEPQVQILKDIGMRIVEKCDGLPLAVKVMGGLLRHKRIRRTVWESVLDDSLWSLSQIRTELNYAIYLSYEDLNPCLKPCFLHYSLLPPGTLFLVHDIISMWISEGFVHGTSGDLEDIGRQYYDELIKRNLIEPNTKYVDQVVCNMHDIVRSFAQYVYGNEALIVHSSESGISEKLRSQKFIRLSLEKKQSEPRELEWCSLQTQIALRTLISVGDIKINPGDSFLSLSSLRTLHLDSVNFDALAESLYQLKHLRYLSIKNSNVSRLPGNIGKLKFLQYISLFDCRSLVMLPGSIGMLEDLRFLRLEGTNISVIPREFCGLTSLRKLYGFPVHMDCDHCSLDELGPLSQLRELSINFLENVASSSSDIQAKLGDKTHQTYLSLRCTSKLRDDGLLVNEEERIFEIEKRKIEEVFSKLCPPISLEHLYIKGYFGQRLPRWMMPTASVTLLNLRIVAIDDLACCTELPSCFCQLPYLEDLYINRAPAIKRVGVEFVQPNNQVGVVYPMSQKLYFKGMVEWEEWEWEKQVKAMPILKNLHIIGCKLRRMPPGLAFNAKALKGLHVHDVKHLSSLENFPSVVQLDLFGNTDLERISNLPKLQKLVIIKCPKLKVLEGMPALQSLTLEDYDIEIVPRYLQDVNPRHLLLYCSLPLLTAIAAGKSCPEWDKFSHIEQVKAYAHRASQLNAHCPFSW